MQLRKEEKGEIKSRGCTKMKVERVNFGVEERERGNERV